MSLFSQSCVGLDGEELHLTQFYLWKSVGTEDFSSIFLYNTSPFKSGGQPEDPLRLKTPSERAGVAEGNFAQLYLVHPYLYQKAPMPQSPQCSTTTVAAQEAVHEYHSEASAGPERSLGNDGFALVCP